MEFEYNFVESRQIKCTYIDHATIICIAFYRLSDEVYSIATTSTLFETKFVFG